MAEVQYATNGKGNLGVTLGAIGTGLGALAGAGGLAGLFGVRPNGGDPDDRPVTRYEMGLIQENTLLKANQYTDNKMLPQAVWNATQEGIIGAQAQQIAQLFSMTRLMIPNQNIAPGWGSAFVVPGVPPVPTIQTTPPTVSSNGTTT